jgi:hypothetical protein
MLAHGCPAHDLPFGMAFAAERARVRAESSADGIVFSLNRAWGDQHSLYCEVLVSAR